MAGEANDPARVLLLKFNREKGEIENGRELERVVIRPGALKARQGLDRDPFEGFREMPLGEDVPLSPNGESLPTFDREPLAGFRFNGGSKILREGRKLELEARRTVRHPAGAMRGAALELRPKGGETPVNLPSNGLPIKKTRGHFQKPVASTERVPPRLAGDGEKVCLRCGWTLLRGSGKD
jgi:hypothetical protein